MKPYIVIFSSLLLFIVMACRIQQGLSSESDYTVTDKKVTGKIAVAADGDNENSEISDIAGRAAWLLIFDGNGNFLKSIRNPALNIGGGASTEVVNLLVRESCKIFIAGQFGFKMEAQLKANNIDYYIKQGSAKNVVQKF
ncbi:MAG: NifB/NifX family molybdenum-iron cluster-binding protein [Prolixibacteraceae bacterium]|nr:NifB/NifX family molybdenum-iron cluster-binding protein [Prolixibacteraceae bacterium]